MPTLLVGTVGDKSQASPVGDRIAVWPKLVTGACNPAPIFAVRRIGERASRVQHEANCMAMAISAKSAAAAHARRSRLLLMETPRSVTPAATRFINPLQLGAEIGPFASGPPDLSPGTPNGAVKYRGV